MKIFATLLLTCCCGIWVTAAPTSAPKINLRQLIRDSGSLQKHEPEMTESELAICEKTAPIMVRRPALALKLLTAMSSTAGGEDAKPSPAFEFMMGNAFYAAGNYPEAEVRLRSAVEQSPTFVRAWGNLGVLYYVQDRFSEAVPCFSKAVALGNHDPATFGLLGNSFEKIGNTISAEMAYMQALVIEPKKVDWIEGLIRIYLRDKHHAKAEPLVRSLLNDHPHETRYWLTQVSLLLSSGRKIEATALLETLHAMGLAQKDDICLLADLYAEQRMVSGALACLERVAAFQPQLAEQKLLQLTRLLIAERSWEGASSVLDALSKTDLSARGRIAWREARVEREIARRDWIGAKSELEALIQEAPENGTAWFGLGRVYMAEAEESKAIEAFERARGLPETAYRASLELANIAYKGFHYESCLGYLEHAMSIEPSPVVENFRNHVRNLTAQGKSSP